MRNYLFIAGLLIGSVTSHAADTASGNRKAPELAFTVPGQGEQLLSHYRGKVVALEFILTTCPHCQAASGVMTKFQQEYGPRGFQALDVALDAEDARTPADSALVVENFTRHFQVGFPVGYTSRDQMSAFTGFSIAERYVVPQIILIDRKGIIHYETPPLGDETSLKEETIRQRIEELLALGNSTAAHHASATGKLAAKNNDRQ